MFKIDLSLGGYHQRFTRTQVLSAMNLTALVFALPELVIM